MNIILDTNLLLLLVVGCASPEYISKHKRLRAFDEDDFRLLSRILHKARTIVVTPNTLTETSNLAGYVAEPARSSIFRTFHAISGQPRVREWFVDSKIAASRAEFVRLGLTDSVILEISKPSYVLLTIDLDLYLAACRNGLEARNFHHYSAM